MNVPIACSFWLHCAKSWLTRLEIVTAGYKTRLYGCSPSTRQHSSLLGSFNPFLCCFLPTFLSVTENSAVSHDCVPIRSALPFTRPETSLKEAVCPAGRQYWKFGEVTNTSQGHSSPLVSVCCQFSAKHSNQWVIQPPYPPNMIPRQLAIVRRPIW
jgi:hypothetical protein